LKRRTGDPAFAAFNVGGTEMMLHADHTYDKPPWHGPLTRGERRGLGAELRVFGLDPDAMERRAEVMVEDPDGHRWAVGVPSPSTRGS
jgi:hypothetical protein